MKQVWITDIAFEYVRKRAFETKLTLGKVASKLILDSVTEEVLHK